MPYLHRRRIALRRANVREPYRLAETTPRTPRNGYTQKRRAILVVLVVTAVGVLIVPSALGDSYQHSRFTYQDRNDDRKIDPITFVMYGTQASAYRTQQHTQYHTTWIEYAMDADNQYAKDHGTWTETDQANASRAPIYTRYHVRWNQGGSLGHDGYVYSAGTPHFEETSDAPGCANDPFPDSHAVVSFVDGREVLKGFFPAHHARFYRYDGSITRVRQCNDRLVGSDGAVIWMRLDAS
jgi:hypothetical protein